MRTVSLARKFLLITVLVAGFIFGETGLVQAAVIDVNQETILTIPQESDTYLKIQGLGDVINGRIAYQETVLSLDTAEIAKNRELEMTEFNNWVTKYPFIGDFSPGWKINSEQYKAFGEQVNAMPADDKEKFNVFFTNAFRGNILLKDQPEFVRRGIRVLPVDNVGPSYYIEFKNQKSLPSRVELGSTGLAWLESNHTGAHVIPKDFKPVYTAYYLDFATNKEIKIVLPAFSATDKPAVTEIPFLHVEYQSVKVRIGNRQYKWDLKANTLTSYGKLVKLPSGYNAETTYAVEGSHYIAWYLAAPNTKSSPRIVWLDTTTKKQFTMTIPKEAVIGDGFKIYGEAAYSTHHDRKTNKLTVWKFDLKTKKTQKVLEQTVQAYELALDHVEGSTLVFKGSSGMAKENPVEKNLDVLVLVDAQRKTVTRLTYPRAQYRSNRLLLSETDPVAEATGLTTHQFWGYTKGRVIFSKFSHNEINYITYALFFSPKEGYEYKATAHDFLKAKWDFATLNRSIGDLVSYPISQ